MPELTQAEGRTGFWYRILFDRDLILVNKNANHFQEFYEMMLKIWKVIRWNAPTAVGESVKIRPVLMRLKGLMCS